MLVSVLENRVGTSPKPKTIPLVGGNVNEGTCLLRSGIAEELKVEEHRASGRALYDVVGDYGLTRVRGRQEIRDHD
jgi:hypothetical protein